MYITCLGLKFIVLYNLIEQSGLIKQLRIIWEQKSTLYVYRSVSTEQCLFNVQYSNSLFHLGCFKTWRVKLKSNAVTAFLP